MKKSHPFPSKLRGVQSGEQVSPGRCPRSVTLSAIAFVFCCLVAPHIRPSAFQMRHFGPCLSRHKLCDLPSTAAPRASSELHLASASRLSRRERALLVPRRRRIAQLSSAKRPEPVDADEWKRTKLDYERSCYRRAEAATRDRLRQLQKVVRQTATAAVPPRPVKDVPRRDEPYAPFYRREFGTPYAYGGFA